MNRTGESRRRLAIKRITSVLSRHGVANMRTLEQKISDAGPYDQRIDPHVLTRVCSYLVGRGQVACQEHVNANWYFLPQTPERLVEERLREQLKAYRKLLSHKMCIRIGQSLEIAIYRALLRQQTLEHFGSFPDLHDHDDNQMYRKREPPQSVNEFELPNNQYLDFIVRHPTDGWAAIEAKNVRPWLYPHEDKIRKLLHNAACLNCVPVLICRRYPFVTFKMLSACGVILHQTYNQRLPQSERALAESARDKTLLGYHDIRLGNKPDSRLLKFIEKDLPQVLPLAREKFDRFKDLLYEFGSNSISYPEFAIQVLDRLRGLQRK